jgi:hypothetical protein
MESYRFDFNYWNQQKEWKQRICHIDSTHVKKMVQQTAKTLCILNMPQTMNDTGDNFWCNVLLQFFVSVDKFFLVYQTEVCLHGNGPDQVYV